MKTTILAISDIHNRFDRFPPNTMPHANFVLIAGDFTDWGEREPGYVLAAKRWMDALAERYAVYYILGNHDIGLDNRVFETVENAEPLEKPGQVRVMNPPMIRTLEGHVEGHEVPLESGRWRTLLLTGINLSPCFDVPEMQTTWRNMTARPEVDALAFEALDPIVDIVVSHCPPFACLDNAGYVIGEGNRHIGSPGLRKYIEVSQPKLVVCGHVHQAVGVKRIGKSVVVNTAQSATLITIDDAGEIETEVIG